MNIQDIYYHGVRDQIRRVLGHMTEEQLDKGMTAFTDGASNWSHCFFARAYAGEANLDRGKPELKLMELLALPSPVPIRIVYCTFDGANKTMNRQQLRQFIDDVRDEKRPDEVMNLIRSIDYTNCEAQEVWVPAGCEVSE